MVNGAKQSDDFTDFDENDLEDVIEQVPGLVRIRQLAKQIARINWFDQVGEPFEPDTIEAAQTYLDLLGFPEASILPVQDWHDAAELAENPDFDTLSWEAEEQLRARLESEALEKFDGQALSVALAFLNEAVSASITEAADHIAALWDITDTALMQAAIGSVHQTCQTYALSLLCELDDKCAIDAKFVLYTQGRWPIGITGASFNLF